MSENHSPTNLAVLFVIYNCDYDIFFEKVICLCKKYLVIIIDNSDNQAIEKHISVANLLFIKKIENTGLCRAVNEGVEIAKLHNIDKVIYFDQDTDVNTNLIEHLILSYEKTDKIIDNLGVVAPYYHCRNPENNYYIKLKKSLSDNLFFVTETITSGMVFSVKLFTTVGGFLEDLFLDYADYEFCWRLSKLGYCIVIDTSIVMYHQIGYSNIKLGNRYIPVSSPVRNYYQMRNIIYLASRGRMLNFEQTFKNIVVRLISGIVMLLFADHKINRFYYLSLGFIHGFIGKGFMGKFRSQKR